MTQLYSTTSSVIGARNGTGKLSDSAQTFNLTSPGSGKDGVNPEQLFAVGYGACFDGALGLVKKAEGANFDSEVQVMVNLNKAGDANFFLSGNIHVIASNTDIDADTLASIVEKTHQICPYSKAIAGNVEMTLSSEIKA
ncbi:MAG: Ohr family peroxiredoxin [Moraxella sp.]|nr:Ohr family peroxiredoxin [Moraxella sp.]